MILETVLVGPMEVNCYILAASKNQEAIIIDPGAEVRKIRQVLEKYGLKASLVINTHGHFDHIGCDDKFGVPVYIHSQDFAFLKDPQLNLSGVFALGYEVKSEIRPLEDNQIIGTDDIELRVLHIPGHTPGGIALQLIRPQEKIVFTGDTLFCQGIGRSDFSYGNESLLVKSIKERLFSLPDDTVIYPGHGPATTIAAEKRDNPYLA